jgi:hypothetical protein
MPLSFHLCIAVLFAKSLALNLKAYSLTSSLSILTDLTFTTKVFSEVPH